MAPLIGQTEVADEDVRLASTRLVRPFNVLGLPALSIPNLTSSFPGGLPVGLQVAGPQFSESGLLVLAGSICKS